VVLDAPNIASPQSLCAYPDKPLTIADIATNGNTNIVWYNSAYEGDLLPSSTEILSGHSYYATVQAGTCQSSSRTEVIVTIGNNNPSSPVIESPQYFCEGALIANITVPDNQIVWYTASTGGIQLTAIDPLENEATYYAAHKAGSCESETRTAVKVYLTAPAAPAAPETQTICGKLTLADLTITGAGITWYDESGNPVPPSTSIVAGESYWAAQTSTDQCVGAKIKITINNNCYVAYGTVFPFVFTNNPAHDDLFPVTAKLYSVPTTGGYPILAILTATPIQTTLASYYNGSVHIPGTPVNPGVIGATNNPGLPINWAMLGKQAGVVNNTPVTEGQIPITPVGMYKFENLVPGTYILEISRPGYLTRWGQITIEEDGTSLGHREIIAGDVNSDFIIDMSDASNMVSYEYEKVNGIGNYNPLYDLDGDGEIGGRDIEIIIDNVPANIGIYVETDEWINK
jgi:hypothetical protein